MQHYLSQLMTFHDMPCQWLPWSVLNLDWCLQTYNQGSQYFMIPDMVVLTLRIPPVTKYRIVLNKRTCLNKCAPGLSGNPHIRLDGIYPQNKWKWVKNGWKHLCCSTGLPGPSWVCQHAGSVYSALYRITRCKDCTIDWLKMVLYCRNLCTWVIQYAYH